MQTSTTPETTAIANFTDSKRKVEKLLALNKIRIEDLKAFTKPECDYLAETCTSKLQELTGVERDNFLDKIDSVIPATTKSDIWDHNHAAISNAISRYMRQHGIMPSKNTIVSETGLSRQTIYKHFAAYKRQPELAGELEQFKFMAPRVLANVFKFALNGDIRAARLYFEMVGLINKRENNTVVNEQNNFIQINNTILSQENLKHLTEVQLQQIEDIIRSNELVRANASK